MDTLKPIPPEIKLCPYCKNIFMSLLRINGKFYKIIYQNIKNHYSRKNNDSGGASKGGSKRKYNTKSKKI